MSDNIKLTPNVPLLRKAVEWVEAQDTLPEDSRQWLQHSYVVPEHVRISLFRHEPDCGTAFCVAGYIGQLLDPRYERHTEVEGVHVSDFAAHALGIRACDQIDLFSGDNTAEMVREVAERIAGQRL